jgi:hypothetical protein
MLKTFLILMTFLVSYIAIDTFASILPWWVGAAIVLWFVGFLITILVKIGRLY